MPRSFQVTCWVVQTNGSDKGAKVQREVIALFVCDKTEAVSRGVFVVHV